MCCNQARSQQLWKAESRGCVVLSILQPKNMGWDGMGWDGMGWDGMGCTGEPPLEVLHWGTAVPEQLGAEGCALGIKIPR